MRRTPLAFALLLLSRVSLAASPAELVACFDALQSPGEDGKPVSEGAGADLSRWEWAPPKSYTAIAVASKRNGREGFYFYGASSADWVHFASPETASLLQGAWHRVPFELRPKGEGRGYFHCVYGAVQLPAARPTFDCDFTGREPKYFAPAVEPLKGADADWAPLRTAVLERVMSVHAVFARRAASYGEGLERWRKRNSDPRPGWASVAGAVGMDTQWYFAKPSEPERGAARKALSACATMDDEMLRGAAKTEIGLLDSAPLPK